MATKFEEAFENMTPENKEIATREISDMMGMPSSQKNRLSKKVKLPVLDDIIVRTTKKGGSLVFLSSDAYPSCRIGDKLEPITQEPITDYDCELIAKELAGERYNQLLQFGVADFCCDIAGRRCLTHLFRQGGHISCIIRLLNDDIPKMDSLRLPPVINSLLDSKQGLIILAGKSGSGKSTTMAAILDEINHTRYGHILVLKRTIDYAFIQDKCIISQREIGVDTPGYDTCFKDFSMESPDYVFIDELQDEETIEMAIRAAEAGTLVFATLQRGSAISAIDGFIDSFPIERQSRIQKRLASNLLAVICQQLLPGKGMDSVELAFECLVNTPAISRLIMDAKTEQIAPSMVVTANLGAITMDNSLINLASRGMIDRETALKAGRDKEYLRKRLLL